MKNKTKHARNLHLIEMKKFLNWTAEQIWKIMISIDRGASFSYSSFAAIKKNLSSRTLDETIMRHDAQRLQWLFYTNEIVLFSFLFWFPLEKLLPFSLGSDRCNPSVKLSAIIKIQKNGIPDARFSGDDWQHQITIVHNFRCGYISETDTHDFFYTKSFRRFFSSLFNHRMDYNFSSQWKTIEAKNKEPWISLFPSL